MLTLKWVIFMKIKKTTTTLLTITPLLVISVWLFISYLNNSQYGVFVGINPDNIEKCFKYNEVVIDASCFDKKDIDTLHSKNVRVYSYLNIGSIEDFRPYYNEFLNITLGDYENWPSEKWIDPSQLKWQDYIVNTLARDLFAKGVDGLFLDNIDVYSIYKSDKTFNGIKAILTRLSSKYEKPIIVNGGYDFFEDAVSKKIDIRNLSKGINLESVFTDIDFENKSFRKRKSSESDDVVEYLNNLKDLGMDIYVIEYSKSKYLNFILQSRYNVLGYKYYISDNIELK